MRSQVYVLVLALLAPMSISATTDECAPVLQLAGNNVTARESKESSEAAQADQFCDEKFDLMTSSAQQELEASYGVFSASYGGATQSLREFRSKYCRAGHQQFTARREVSDPTVAKIWAE